MSDTTTLGAIDENVIRRIQKLLALAGKNPNEHEAAAAAEKAMALAAAHGMELAQLEAKTESTGPMGGKREKKVHDRAAMYKYQRTLMNAVAGVHFCKHFVNEVETLSCGKMRKAKRHVLLGRELNVQMALMTYDYLVETMDRILPYQGMDKRGRQALLWLEGCADRLAARLILKRRMLEEESRAAAREAEVRAKHPGAAQTGNSLVLADAYSSEEDYNNDFEQGWEPGTTARMKREQKARNAAAMAEWEAGRPAREAAARQRREDAKAKAEAMNVDPAILTRLIYLFTQGWYTDAECLEKAQAEHKKAQAQSRAIGKPETEAQRAKRERAERVYEDRRWREEQRHNRKYGSAEYQAGSRTGEKIGLDTQVTSQERAKLA